MSESLRGELLRNHMGLLSIGWRRNCSGEICGLFRNELLINIGKKGQRELDFGEYLRLFRIFYFCLVNVFVILRQLEKTLFIK